ncbi:GlsB/YeaQ/YmgE family stress response membrane protein [Jannaschia sp. 2305UL9-9]|uniref:GlsB/YeaQ/YmgE family stress response membrane protein n=1 Tax=Jannaschia sp. 2305UL9-9 TaxID=3121638 RepID=UPI0035272E0F
MEGFFEGLGVVALVILAVVGLAVGLLAGAVTGHSKALYAIVGAAAAMATPFILAALGVGILAAGGVLLVAVTGLVGAVVVVIAVRALSSRG